MFKTVEFRQIVKPISSHRTVRCLSCEFKTLLTFSYLPERPDPQPFAFVGTEILELAQKQPEDWIKGYFVWVEQEGQKTNIYILENFQDILTVNKNTNLKLFDLVQVIK